MISAGEEGHWTGVCASIVERTKVVVKGRYAEGLSWTVTTEKLMARTQIVEPPFVHDPSAVVAVRVDELRRLVSREEAFEDVVEALERDGGIVLGVNEAYARVVRSLDGHCPRHSARTIIEIIVDDELSRIVRRHAVVLDVRVEAPEVRKGGEGGVGVGEAGIVPTHVMIACA
jgi:hypothetical protein